MNINSITLPAYAKINLSLDVLGKQSDGYHQVKMVMHQVELHDRVTVNWQPGQGFRVTLSCQGSELPVNEDNIAYKAALIMKERYGALLTGDVEVILEKHIPVAAGLAGGSADGAAVMLALSQLWELNVSLPELMKTGKALGADVPFCIMGQTAAGGKRIRITDKRHASTCALAEGIGEILTPLPSLPIQVLLCKPDLGVSTAEVYGGLNLEAIEKRPDTQQLISGIREHNLNKITLNMVNLLETVTLTRFPQVAEEKSTVEQLGLAAAVLMSGSGPTIFALFTNGKKAKLAYTVMKKRNLQTWLTKTLCV